MLISYAGIQAGVRQGKRRRRISTPLWSKRSLNGAHYERGASFKGLLAFCLHGKACGLAVVVRVPSSLRRFNVGRKFIVCGARAAAVWAGVEPRRCEAYGKRSSGMAVLFATARCNGNNAEVVFAQPGHIIMPIVVRL